MKDNNIENIVTLELVKEDELYKFKRLTRIIFSSSNRRVWLCRCLLINIGMIMNIFSLLGGILIVLSPNAMKLIIKMSVNLLSKLKLFKTLNEKLNIINKFIDEYSYSINLFVKNKSFIS